MNITIDKIKTVGELINRLEEYDEDRELAVDHEGVLTSGVCIHDKSEQRDELVLY